MSTTKMVATKLIAEGSLWVGVELLCLAGKVWDACTYLRASKHWSDCIWLAKCRLSDADYCQISKKYADHLVSEGKESYSFAFAKLLLPTYMMFLIDALISLCVFCEYLKSTCRYQKSTKELLARA